MHRLRTKSNSFNQNRIAVSKVSFQTKLKIRGTNQHFDHSVTNQKDSQNQSFDIGTSQNLRNNKSYSNYQPKTSELHQTCNMLSRMNFSHHNSDQCMCNQCTCGRHLCKLHVIKPDLRKSTSYQNSFKRSKSIKNTPILQKQENRTLPKVQMNSTYSFTFKNKDVNNVIKPHPEDQLKFQGPSQNLTSYKTNFPGNRGNNPYVNLNQKQVRPKQVFVSGQFPFKNRRSSYRQSFNKITEFKVTQTGKIKDQLKTGKNNLFKESYYQEKFKSPNPEDFPTLVNNKDKLELNPDFPHQYGKRFIISETSYNNAFVKIQSTVCPSKIKLQTRYKDVFTNRMNNFAQNSDFKALSSTFQALSTSPYGQYQ